MQGCLRRADDSLAPPAGPSGLWRSHTRIRTIAVAATIRATKGHCERAKSRMSMIAVSAISRLIAGITGASSPKSAANVHSNVV